MAIQTNIQKFYKSILNLIIAVEKNKKQLDVKYDKEIPLASRVVEEEDFILKDFLRRP